MLHMTNIRAEAAIIITKVVTQKKSLDEILANYVTKFSSPLDQALLQELTYGTLRWYYKLDTIAKLLLHKIPKKNDTIIYVLILIGLYQLLHLRIPQYAILSETVEATRTIEKPWATKLVNATLRNFIRRKDEILSSTKNNIAIQYSHPQWFIHLLQQHWPNNWQDILIANNEHPPMHLRVNLQKITRDDYLKQLPITTFDNSNISATLSSITLKQPCNISQLPGFQNGLVSVQDLAAQYAANLLDLKPNLRVLDACAAPGGKTTHILETEPHLQELIALDISNKRLALIKDNLDRLQLSAKLICNDVINTQSWWDGKKFDRILLDAPCSGTGVIRRHPDIKILRQFQDIEKNAKYQLQLLEKLWPLLTENGLLVYATCSILPEENFLVIEKFLQKHQDAKEKNIIANWGIKVKHGRQLFPTNNSNDGFFYALITKKG